MSQHTLPYCTLHTANWTLHDIHCKAQDTLLSAHTALPVLHCTARGWVHFWWDDSNGLVVHSAEGQKRPQAAGCTMGRAITHCTHCTYCTLHTLHTAHKTPAHYTLSALHTEHCKQHNTKRCFGHTRVCCTLQSWGLSKKQYTTVDCSHGDVGVLLAGRLRSCGAAGPPGQLEIRLITQNSCSARPHNSCREGTNTEQSSGLRIWSIIQNSYKQPLLSGQLETRLITQTPAVPELTLRIKQRT